MVVPFQDIRVAAPELSIVVPTFQERDNVAELIRRLSAVLSGCAWEVIFVDDDSPDGTAEAIRELGRQDIRVRCIRRVGRRGLSGATIEGMLASNADYVAVMDADLQHEETALVKMLEQLRGGSVDLVVGSRFADGSDLGDFARKRRAASGIANGLARTVLGVDITDPMSGFFMLRRERLNELAPHLSTQGFKILLDLIVTGKGRLRVAEIPYRFGTRLSGESKLDSRVALDFAGMLASKLTRDLIPPRFFFFALVGFIGLAVHLGTLDVIRLVLQRQFHLPADQAFGIAQIVATVVAMTGNFFLNNRLTYRDQRLSGWSFFRGLLGFYAICSFGALVSYGLATAIFAQMPIWWLAGGLGAVGGAIWNFAMANAFVWRVR